MHADEMVRVQSGMSDRLGVADAPDAPDPAQAAATAHRTSMATNLEADA